jgi:hypothetical protein
VAIDQHAIQDAFTSMLRTDYIPLKDTERLNLLSRYYVDYFGYISQIVGEQDQLIVGRRGTGKTTLLYRGLIECMTSWTQQQCAAKPRTLGIYLDLSKCQLISAESDQFSEFEHMVVSEICDAISDELTRSWPELRESPGFFARLFESVEQKKVGEVQGLLKQLATVLTTGKPRFFDRSGKVDARELGRMSEARQSGVDATLSPKKVALSVSSSSKAESGFEIEEKSAYEVTYRLSVADILRVIDDLRTAAAIPTVILFVDEFSSLTDELQRRFTTLLKSLLGNHAGLFVKLCAITDNYTLGSSVILQRDLFEVSLDFDAFVDRSGSLKGAMSELEVLTEKIVRERLKVFADVEVQDLFDDPSDAWMALSRESMGVPRTIGIALQQAWYRAKGTQRTKIRKTDVEYGIGYASKAYLGQMLGASKGGVAIPAYIEDIWDAILHRAISERPKSDSPASHFMVLPKNEAKLKLLNMFFVVHLLTGGRTTKKEKASRSLYAIDYGICFENHLGYGDDKNVLRQQRFAYDDALTQFDKYFDLHDEVMYVCPTCKAVYSERDLMVAGQMLKFCPKDKADLQRMSHDPTALKYTEEEIKIIGSIRSSGPDDKLTARQIADDVGCYVQKVAKFGERLDREEIIDRQKLETIGKHIYFNPAADPGLGISIPEDTKE